MAEGAAVHASSEYSEVTLWPSDWAGKVADVAGVIGLLFSILAWIQAAQAAGGVKRLERQFARRDLLPKEAAIYQTRYSELQVLLSTHTKHPVPPGKLGEFRGALNGLDDHLDKGEKQTLNRVKALMDLIGREPNTFSHRESLIEEAGALSAELDAILRKIRWNNPS